MPLFIFISGYFSKHIDHQRRREIDMLLYPFLVFQVLNILYYRLITSSHCSINLFNPQNQNWYLLSLFFWRTFTPYCKSFNKWAVIGTTLLFAFVIGFSDNVGEFLSLHRTFYWFPVFLLGYYCGDLMRLAAVLQKYKFVIVPVCIACVAGICILSMSEDTYRYDFYGFVPGEGHHKDFLLLLSRMMAYLVSVVMSLGFICVMSLMCDRWSWINKTCKRLGGTMLLYLVHFFFIFQINPVIIPLGGYAPVIMFGISIVLFIIFTNKSVVKYFEPLADMSAALKMLRNARHFLTHDGQSQTNQ